MSKGQSYLYRYLYKGKAVHAVFFSQATLQKGVFQFPDGSIKVRHFSSFEINDTHAYS